MAAKREVMSQTEEDLTRYELVEALKAQVDGLEKRLKSGVGTKGKYNKQEKTFLKQRIKNLKEDIKSKSTFTLIESIKELGFCYDVGTTIQYLIEAHVSRRPDDNYKPLHEEYSRWFTSISYAILCCPEIHGYYINFFTNAGNNKLTPQASIQEIADEIADRTEPILSPENDFADLVIKLDKLESIIYRLEEQANLQIRQYIAKQEQDASTKYELRYSKARELTLNGIPLAHPDFLSENDQFLNFIFKEGNSWRNVSTGELLEYMKTDKLSKTIHQILSDLNITGSVKDIFMPNVSTKGFEFRNPISHGFAYDNKLPVIDMKPVRNSKK